jgi:hypothetical protein
MNRRRSGNWFGGPGHLSDEELLACLDGELKHRNSRRVQAHLESCWACRARAQKIERGIADFVDRRNALVETSPPPRGWAGFEARLGRATAELGLVRPSAFARVRPLAIRLAGLAAIAVAVLIWVQFSPRSSLSAKELLARTQSAESLEAGRGPDPVIHQRVEVRRRRTLHSSEETAVIESWRHPTGVWVKRCQGGELWRELEGILRENHMGSERLLSAVAFEAWRGSIVRRSEQVVSAKLPDGSSALTLRTVSGNPARVGAILEAELVVRPGDFHPVRQNLQVQGGAEVQKYDLVEVGFEVAALHDLDASIFGARPTAPRLPVPAPTRRPVTLPAPPVPDAEDTEIAAVFALHRTGACRGEEVQVARDSSGGVVVRGLVESTARKLELLDALSETPAIQAAIETVQERQAAKGPAPALTEAASSLIELRNGDLPIAQRLRASGFTDAEMTALANRAVSLSENVLAEAWALRRLAEAYPAEKIARLREPSRRRLEQMIREHALELRQQFASLRGLFEPLSPGSLPETVLVPGEFDWPADVSKLFAAAESASRIAHGLFSSSGEPAETVADAILRLHGVLNEAEGRSRMLASSSAQVFQTNSESQHADSRRIP